VPGPKGSAPESKTQSVGVKFSKSDFAAIGWYADQVGRKSATLLREVGGMVALRLAQDTKRRVGEKPSASQRVREANRYADMVEKMERL